MDGLFDLTGFESKNADDTIGLNQMTESSEFVPNGNATNNVSNGVQNATVSVPGGDKETPNAKPYDANNVTVPGGDNEKPTAKPYDANELSTPAKVELSEEQYNNALANLKKSFREAADVIEMLENANVHHVSTQEMQESYNDDVVGKAILEAYENGPMFEAVSRSDKDAVKDIVKTLRPKIADELKADGRKFYKPNLVARAITGLVPVVGTSNMVAAIQQAWTMRLWQVIGIVLVEPGNVNEMSKKLTENHKEELGDYKVLHINAAPAILDYFRTRFNFKNDLDCYFLVVDKKVPSELEEFNKQVEEGAQELKKSDKDSKKNEK